MVVKNVKKQPRQPQQPKRSRQRTARRRKERKQSKAEGKRMTPSACRTLALASPCAFAEAVDRGDAVLQHARDQSTAANTTVQIIKGVAQFTADANGNAAVFICPTLKKGICQLGATAAADVWTDIPGAAAAAGIAQSVRMISLEVDYTCMSSNMLNAGSSYLAGLDPSMGNVDYRNEAGANLAARVSALRAIIDDRPRGSYAASAAKDPNKVVIARSKAQNWIGDATATYRISHDGDAFEGPQNGADSILYTQTTPIAMTLRIQDVHPVAALALTGAAASMPFQLQVCMAVEIIPSSTVMATTPGGAAGVGGFSGVASKIASNVSVHSLESAEHYGERAVEGALTLAGYAGVPGASAASGALHAGQGLLERFEHSSLGAKLHLN